MRKASFENTLKEAPICARSSSIDFHSEVK